jgi:hypothetical protein
MSRRVFVVVALVSAVVAVAASVVTYRPAAVAGGRPGPAPSQAILSTLAGLAGSGTAVVTGKLSRHAQAWQPSPGGIIPARDIAACSAQVAEWDDGETPTIDIVLRVARCGSIENARDLQWASLQAASNEVAIRLPPVVPGAFEGQGSPFTGWPTGAVQEIIFRRGTYVTDVFVYLAMSRGGDVSTFARAIAAAQAGRLPGTPGSGAQAFSAVVADQLPGTAAVVVFYVLAVWLPIGYVRRKLRQPRARTPGLPGMPGLPGLRGTAVASFDVTPAARRGWRTARWAVALGLMTILLAPSPLYAATSRGLQDAYGWLGVAAGCAALYLARRAGRVTRPATRPRLTGTEALWLLLAAACVVAAALAFALGVDLGPPNRDLAITDGRIDPSILSAEPLWHWAATLPVHLAGADALAAGVLLTLVAGACRRRAQAAAAPRTPSRLALNPGKAPFAAPGRRISYMPGDQTERLRLRTSATGRPTLAERVSLRQFEDFHDVAVRILSAFGGVTTGLTSEAQRPGDVVVVNASPPASYQPPAPELSASAWHGRLSDVLLVFPPAPSAEVFARWDFFRTRNADFLPASGSGDAIGKHADRMLVARWAGHSGWQCWHADVKSDWAYAIALADALGARDAVNAAPVPVPSHWPGHMPPPWTTPPAEAQTPLPSGLGASRDTAAPQAIPVVPRTPAPPGRGWRIPSRRLGAVLGAAALLILAMVNAVAIAVTEPGPFDPAGAAAEYLLQPGAVRSGFAYVKDVTTSPARLSVLEQHRTTCAQRIRDWTAPAARLTLQIAMTVCTSPAIVAAGQERTDRYAVDQGWVTGTGGIPYGVEFDSPPLGQGGKNRQHEVVFRSGPALVTVILFYPGKQVTAAQGRLVEQVAATQARSLPQQPGPGFTAVLAGSAVRAALKHWFGLTLTWAILLYTGWRWWTRRRYSARVEGPPPTSTERVVATSVTGHARWAAWLARGRLALQLSASLCLVNALAAPPPGRYAYAAAGIVMLAVAPFLRSRSLGLPLRVRLRSGVLTGRRTVTAVSLTLLGLVAAIASIGLAILGVFFLVMQFSLVVLPSGRSDPALLGPGLADAILRVVPVSVLGLDLLVLAAAAAIAVPVSYMAARRIAALSANEATKGADGAATLYLRNFSDDDIRMPTSRLARNSLVERIAVFRVERFEEVIVRHLARYGPVIAVSPPGLDRPPIGAARMNLPNEQWQEGVRQHIAHARLIVVGAAPERHTEGLAWELAQIEQAGALVKTMLLLPPPAGDGSGSKVGGIPGDGAQLPVAARTRPGGRPATGPRRHRTRPLANVARPPPHRMGLRGGPTRSLQDATAITDPGKSQEFYHSVFSGQLMIATYGQFGVLQDDPDGARHVRPGRRGHARRRSRRLRGGRGRHRVPRRRLRCVRHRRHLGADRPPRRQADPRRVVLPAAQATPPGKPAGVTPVH